VSEAVRPLDRTEVESRIRTGPFHEWLGVRVLEIGDDRIELSFAWRPEWVVRVEGGYTHGGILATIVDLTADWSLTSRAGGAVPTVDLRVDYHRAARGDLRSVGKVVKYGRTTSVAEAEVFDGAGDMVASGRGVYLTSVVHRQENQPLSR
jgi:uncharacterized protein (TIGR00369 family)